MTAAVAHLVQEALLLDSDARAELVEAILESNSPSQSFLDENMASVLHRMESVQEGRSELVTAEEAHRKMREVLGSAS